MCCSTHQVSSTYSRKAFAFPALPNEESLPSLLPRAGAIPCRNLAEQFVHYHQLHHLTMVANALEFELSTEMKVAQASRTSFPTTAFIEAFHVNTELVTHYQVRYQFQSADHVVTLPSRRCMCGETHLPARQVGNLQCEQPVRLSPVVRLPASSAPTSQSCHFSFVLSTTRNLPLGKACSADRHQ